MARPIEATPVLRGKEAVAFIEAALNPKKYVPPVFDTEKMHAEIQRIMKARAKK